MKKSSNLLFTLLFSTSSLTTAAFAGEREDLGDLLYHDEALSEPDGQSCASCHTISAAFIDPDHQFPVSEGVLAKLFGGRNSPTAAYAMYVPVRINDEEFGGLFWDGRATGEVTGDPLADQALGPFLNPVEMANDSKKTVVRDAYLFSEYQGLFESVCVDGEGIVASDLVAQINSPGTEVDDNSAVGKAYRCIAESIAAFERTSEFAQFSSKYDRYLATCIDEAGDETPATLQNCAEGVGDSALAAAGKVFSNDEWAGMQLFMGENDNDGELGDKEGAFCVACHVVDWTSTASYDHTVYSPDWAPTDMVPPIFTDHTYDNLGVPKSNHPTIRNNDDDHGIGGGGFRVSTLRNIAKTAPYAHNGFFRDLNQIVNFYNTRDVNGKWKDAEVGGFNDGELGNLGLSGKQEKQLVKFLETLSD